MGSLSSAFILYGIFILIGLLTGVTFWVIHRYRIPAVISLIFALLAPLLTLLFVAQGDMNKGAYTYITEEMSSGNTWARIVVIIHVYLIAWLLFLMVRGIIYLIKSPKVKEIIKKLVTKIRPPQTIESNQDSKSS